MKRLKALCIILLAISSHTYAAPIVSGSSGDWNNPSTWAGGVIPTAGDNVTIANGHTVTVTASASCASLTIGNGILDQSTKLKMNPGILLTVSGNISITAPASGIVDNILDVNAGIVSCASFATSNSLNNNLRCIVTISTGTFSCNGSFLLASNTDRNKLIFSNSGLLQLKSNSNTIADAQLTAAISTIEYNGNTGQTILPLSYYNLQCSGISTKFLSANTNLAGSLVISGSAQLDVTFFGNYNLSVAGNWWVSSTNANPFVERRGTVTLNGSMGIQAVSTPLSQETFYNLVINNTAGNAAADLQFNKTCAVTQTYTHTSGKMDLMGNRLTVVSANRLAGFTQCDLSGGSIISSVAGSQISFTDTYDSTFVNFTGTTIGNSSIPVRLTVNVGRINLENLSLYGIGAFTKRHPYNDVMAKGGNKFYNAVTFTANAPSGSWYSSAGDGALPDSFFSKSSYYSFATNAASKIILGANSFGNYYGDTVILQIRSAGSILVGNSSGASGGNSSSNYFNQLVDAAIRNSGDIIFAEGQSLLPASVTFNKRILLSSTGAGSGNFYIGKNNSGSSVSITSTGQLYGVDIYGNTPIFLYNITQAGSLLQTLSSIDAINGKVICGDINGPCTWNGPTKFTAIILDLAYSTFNGSNNDFSLINSISAQSCTGGNTFAAGTQSAFSNFGTAEWRLSTIASDDYNGNVQYRVNSTGAIFPAYNTNCTYAGSITVLPGSDTIFFAAGGNGRVTLDGNTSGNFINNSTKPVLMYKLTSNKTAGTFGLYSNLFIPAGGNIVLASGRIVTGATGLLVLQDETCTITSNTAASTSYIDGPMRIDVSTTSPVTLHFPIGKDLESRPVDLSIQHTSNTSYSYTAEMVRSSANALGYTNTATVTNVSAYRWWDITRTLTSSGAAAPITALVTSPLPVVSLYYGLIDVAPNPADVTICKNTYTALTNWIDIGATGATNTIGKVTSTSLPSAFNSFSRFTLGYFSTPQPPAGRDSFVCGTGSAAITATPVHGEFIDWYAAASGGTALATNTAIFNTPVISSSTTYYAQSRNTRGYVSATRTPVTAYIYNAPVISLFMPASGEAGTAVTINGNNFNNNVSAVTFGGTAAASFTVNSATQITAVVANGTSGSIAVTNGCGTGSKAGFIYNPLMVWTGAINTSWTTAGNWDEGSVPTNIHSVVIPPVPNQPLVSSNQTVKSITIQTGAFVDIAVGNSLNVRDSLTSNGDVIGGGNIALVGTASQSISGIGNYNNLVLNNSNGAVIGSGNGNMVSITGRYTPTSGVLTTNDNITLKSTASSSGTIAAGPTGGNYINGKVIMERHIPGRRAWRLINFPVALSGAPTINQALQENAGGNASSNPNPGYGTHITGGSVANGFDQNSSNNPSMKEWAGGTWAGIASTNNAINNQHPYFLFVRGSRANNLGMGINAPVDNTVLRVKASPKQGSQMLAVAGTGWQLTGNPFPSVINLDAMAAANSSRLNRNFVFWDPKLGGSNNVGGYVTASYNGSGYDYSPAPVSQLSEYAHPFAGFFVDAISTGNYLVSENVKCNCGNGNVFRPVAPANNSTSKMHISLHSINADGTAPVVDGAMAAFGNNFSDETDGFDAAKLNNTLTENISISKNNNKFSIERRKPVAYYDTVFLNISNMKAKDYQLEINTENFDSTGTSAFLEDSYTGSRTQLSLSSENLYHFRIINTPAAYAPERFRVIINKASSDALAKKTSIPAIANAIGSDIALLQNPIQNNTLFLQMKQMKAGRYAVSIASIDGKEAQSAYFTHDGSSSIKKVVLKKQQWQGNIMFAIINGPDGSTARFKILVQ